MLQATSAEIIATVCFALAILHTFSVSVLQGWACRFPEGSIAENLLHLLGEVEVVFGLWGGIYLASITTLHGSAFSVGYLEGLKFTEPAFVFVVMTVAATKPILEWSAFLIGLIAKTLPLPKQVSFYVVALVVGSLMGSFITEPAAMTVTALILLERYFSKKISTKLKYFTLAALFVCISIGGTLTTFAAPPVLMVASIWNWDMLFMLTNFGYKSAIA